LARITRLHIKGYRSIKGPLDIQFPDKCPLVLLGENNAGKSNVIKALNLPLGPFWPGSHEPEDNEFFGRDRNGQIHIGVIFADADLFGGRYNEAHWKYKDDDDPPCTFYGVPGYGGYPTGYVKNDDRETAACMLIEADRNLRYQLSYSSKYTMLSRMMRRFHNALVADDALRAALEKLFDDTKKTFKKLPEFQEFVSSLQEKLTNLVSSMTHRLEVDFEAYNPANFFHALDLHAMEGDTPRALEEMGTGEQQVLAMAFAHAYAKAFHTGVVLVIEEPEAHLHPLAAEWLSKQLTNMCADGLQLVLTTHSPAFVDVLNLEGLVLVRKNDGATVVKQIDRHTLVQHCIDNGAHPDKTSEANILPFYAASATTEILEGFFAKAVVLVEGPTESLSLPIYLGKAGLDTAKEGIAIIPVHGKGNLAKWHRLFEAYEIPCYIMFDNDGKADDKTSAKRRDALTAVGVVGVDQDEYITSTDWLIGERFAVFGSNFEEILRDRFPLYTDLEKKAGEDGIDSKPFVSRYVAEHVMKNNAAGWQGMKMLADELRKLVTA
jgi:putative ATP-dependent endonuclease of the OLD family